MILYLRSNVGFLHEHILRSGYCSLGEAMLFMVCTLGSRYSYAPLATRCRQKPGAAKVP